MSKSKVRKPRYEKSLEQDVSEFELSGNNTSKVKHIPKTKAKNVELTGGNKDLTNSEHKTKIREIMRYKPNYRFKTKSQEEAFNVIDENIVSILYGKSGVGKSVIQACYAISQLWNAENDVIRIYITKPNESIVGTKDLGALPGTADEKMAYYMSSVIDNISRIIGAIACKKLIEDKYIQVVPLQYIRGNSFGHFETFEGKDDAEGVIFICEEAANIDPRALKTILTRIGNCKLLINGDVDQSDKFADYRQSGLYDIVIRLQDLDGIGFYEFTKDSDIVRHPLISKILQRYPCVDMAEELRKKRLSYNTDNKKD